MNRTLKYVGLASICSIAIALTTNCSSSSSGGGRALSDQEAALNKSMTAMASLGNLAAASHVPMDSMRSISASAAQATSAFCKDDGSTLITTGDTTEAFATFLCAGTHNTYSPDSALGALSLMKGIVCTADQNGISYSATGAAVTLNNVALTSTCFPAEMLAKFAAESTPIRTISGTVTGTRLSNSGWDYKMEFTNMSPIDNFTIHVRNSGNVIAAAYQKTGGGESWTVTIDQRATPNRIIYETASNYRHLRLFAEGVISSTGTVTSVDNMGGILADSSGNYVALLGPDATGVKMNFKKGSTELIDQCFDVSDSGAANCNGITINFNDAHGTNNATDFTDPAAIATAEAQFDANPIFFNYAGFPFDNAPAAPFSSSLR